MRKTIYMLLGFVGLALTVVGAVVPLLPAFPFVVLTLFGFGKSSERLHKWFLSTKLYKDNFESFLKGKGMTLKAKLRLVTSVTLTIGIGCYMMGPILIGRLILFTVWVGHVLYFVFRVKTVPQAR